LYRLRRSQRPGPVRDKRFHQRAVRRLRLRHRGPLAGALRPLRRLPGRDGSGSGEKEGVRTQRLSLSAVLAAVVISVLAASCSSGANSNGSGKPPEKLGVVATTVQITALARQVGGDRIQLRGIIPAGADPHEFEATAGDLKAIAEADVILRHGVGLDAFVDKAISSGGSARVVTVTEGLPLRPPALESGATLGAEEAFDAHV